MRLAPRCTRVEGPVNLDTAIRIGSSLLWACLISCMVTMEGLGQNTGQGQLDPAEVAAQILDEERSGADRHRLIEQNPDLSADLLRELTRDLEHGSDEEARRIPWIWRVTVLAGERFEEPEILEILDIALPQVGERMTNWQAVVLGGGVVNGIGRGGEWAIERLPELLAGHPELTTRWRRSVRLAYAMAADPDVPYPWRYDAIRMIAFDDLAVSLPELESYLAPGRDSHLHMGAVSALSDMLTPRITGLLVSALDDLSPENRDLALDALLRTTYRAQTLLDAIVGGVVSPELLGESHYNALVTHSNRDVRERARQLLPQFTP